MSIFSTHTAAIACLSRLWLAIHDIMYMYVHVDWGELWLVDAESTEVCMT